jgi:hypothetical protein
MTLLTGQERPLSTCAVSRIYLLIDATWMTIRIVLLLLVIW